MFDFATARPISQDVAPPRALALDLIARTSARLRRIASRLGGDAGLALICAMSDMIIDTTVDPLHWPIDEAIALLRQPAHRNDIQADRLLEQLEQIRARIESEPDARDP